MSELNEEVQVTVDDAPVATVPLVSNLTADNAAPKASFVGSALAEKADISTIMEHVTITVDGAESDNSGVILLYGDDIPMSSGDSTKISAAITAVNGKTAADIVYTSGTSIKGKVDAVTSAVETISSAMYADQIPMTSSDSTKIATVIGSIGAALYGDQLPMSGSDSTKIATAIAAAAGRTASDIVYSGETKIYGKIETVSSTVNSISADYLSKSSQSLTAETQAQVRSNLGLGTASVRGVANNLTTSEAGGSVLDAAQGYAINQILNPLNTNFSSLFKLVTYEFSYEEFGSGANKTFSASDLEMTPIEGYMPVGVTSIITGLANVAVTRFNLTSSNNYVLTLRNNAGSAQSSSGSMTVLYVRTSAIAAGT